MKHFFWLAVAVTAVAAFVIAPTVSAQTTTVEGNLDDVHDSGWNTPCAAKGWASDPAQPATDITVRVLVDGVVAATALADLFRQDLADAGIGVDGTAAFEVALDMSSGLEQQIRVQAQDLATGEWIDLGSQVGWTCARLFGTHDAFSGVVNKKECVAAGWAFDNDTPTNRVQVRVLVNGKVVAESSANLFRQDVLDAGIGDGFSGWQVNLFGKIQPGSQSVVTVEARDTTNKRLWLPLQETGKLVTCLP